MMMLGDESKSDPPPVDPVAAKIAAYDQGQPPTANTVPVVAAVEVPQQAPAWPQGPPASDKQVVCADAALRGSAGVLLIFSLITFCVGAAAAHNTADLWRGPLVVWGTCPQLIYATVALTALATRCEMGKTSYLYAAAGGLIIPLFFSIFSLSVASAHTRALARLDDCTSGDALSFALGKKASRKVGFNPQYMYKESSHLWYQGYCDFDSECDDAFKLKPERRDFYAERFCMPLNGTAAGRRAADTQGKRGVCAARCAAACNCYKTNADSKGDDLATYSACWQFDNVEGKCGDILTSFKQTADAHAVFASFSLVAGIVFIVSVYLAACLRPLVGTRVHFAPPPPSASVELPTMTGGAPTAAATVPEGSV